MRPPPFLSTTFSGLPSSEPGTQDDFSCSITDSVRPPGHKFGIGSSDLHSNIVSQLFEFVGFGNKIGFTVYFNQQTYPACTMDIRITVPSMATVLPF
jgi:hypothetical protein